MALFRGFLLSLSLAGALAVSACAGDKAPLGENGEPTEALTVVTTKGEHDFWVEIADDNEERARGLMYREALADNRGMLFEFPDVEPRAFWMQNTPNPLDIIYIGADGKVVSIVENAAPFSTEQRPSAGPAKGVLELRGGRAAELGLKPGDQIRHAFFGNP